MVQYHNTFRCLLCNDFFLLARDCRLPEALPIMVPNGPTNTSEDEGVDRADDREAFGSLPQLHEANMIGRPCASDSDDERMKDPVR